MSRWLNTEIIVGLITLCFAASVLLFWIPNDIGGDAINYARRRYSIGDPFAPILICILMLVAAIGLLIAGFGARSSKPSDEAESDRGHSFLKTSAFFMLLFSVLMASSFALMRYVGPWLVGVLGPDKKYAQLVTTKPWNFMGYMLGGFAMLLVIMSVIERRVSLRSILIAFAAPLCIALFYDLPFSLILPPNGRADAG